MEIRSGFISNKISEGDWDPADADGIRKQDVAINFDPPFKTKPDLKDMIAAMSGIEISSGYDININIRVKQVEKNIAVLTVSAAERCLIESIAISWVTHTR
jgi:hypothetical protein